MKKLIIDRNKWTRGGNSPRTYLWNLSKNQGCCLGHYLIQIDGLSEEQLHLLNFPKNVPGVNSLKTLQNFVKGAVAINDNKEIDDKLREQRLIELFKEHNIDLSFKDEQMQYLVEIQAGEGGKDSKLFVNDLFDSYEKFMNKNGTQFEISYKQDGKIGFITNGQYL